MNDYQLYQDYLYKRSKYMSEARRDALRAQILRKAAKQKQLPRLIVRTAGGLRRILEHSAPVQEPVLPRIEDCVGLESS